MSYEPVYHGAIWVCFKEPGLEPKHTGSCCLHSISDLAKRFSYPSAANCLISRPLWFTAIMGISRDSRHKRSATGAKRAYYRKKRYNSALSLREAFGWSTQGIRERSSTSQYPYRRKAYPSCPRPWREQKISCLTSRLGQFLMGLWRHSAQSPRHLRLFPSFEQRTRPHKHSYKVCRGSGRRGAFPPMVRGTLWTERGAETAGKSHNYGNCRGEEEQERGEEAGG